MSPSLPHTGRHGRSQHPGSRLSDQLRFRAATIVLAVMSVILPGSLDAQDEVIHLSRRTNLFESRRQLEEMLGDELAARVHFLMDHRTNRDRYEAQLSEAAAHVSA